MTFYQRWAEHNLRVFQTTLIESTVLLVVVLVTQLKNCGALYANMYLVAESMNLAACALGLGNSTRFASLADCDFYSEGTIGEFMLGTRAWGT